MRLFAFLLLAWGVVSAQVGYPGGYPPTYPGGRSPYPGGGGGGLPLPIPGRSKKSDTTQKKSDTNGQALPNFRGTLKQMDEKSIALEMGDNRVLDFKRTSKTKFFKAGEELKTPQFQQGDQISVEASQDATGTGYFTAVNVYWERSGGKNTTRNDGTPDTWKDAPAAEKSPEKNAERRPEAETSATSATKEASAERAPAPARSDPDDPGPPKLTRGGPANPARERAAEVPVEAPTLLAGHPERPAPERVIRPVEDDSRPPDRLRSTDDLIRRASDAALDFTEGLPAYVCQEVTSRFQSETQKPNWQAIDVVTTNLVYENGKEDYRDIAINGKATKKNIEETGGAWSTGEFGTVLIDLFSPATAAEFHYQREARIAGLTAKLYDFAVTREHSHWSIHSGSQGYNPSYNGSVWIDPQTARVLRIEMQAKGFPQDFPLDDVESATDYQYIRLGDLKQYLLPVHAETLSCQRGTTYCSRNVIDFRNYHKYSGESNITFGAPK